MRYFCTYFDHRYLPQGMALYHSLKEHCPSFHLWILTLSNECYEILNRTPLPDVSLLRLEDVEKGDEDLLRAKGDRSLIEYYFTLSPSFPLYILNHFTEVDLITYLDSDLYFFSDPSPIYDEMGDSSVGIIPHRFPPRLKRFEIHGVYNVGWMSFRRDKNGLACLHWYRERCNEWCYDRVEGDRYADQKYLDKFGQLFDQVHVIEHKGANLAPWNVDNYYITEREGYIYVDEVPLIFFHFHGFKKVFFSCYDSGFASYKSKFTKIIKNRIFVPYLQVLDRYEEFSNHSQNKTIRGGESSHKILKTMMPALFKFLKTTKWVLRLIISNSWFRWAKGREKA